MTVRGVDRASPSGARRGRPRARDGGRPRSRRGGGARGSGALPRVRAAADGRRAPVPPRARRRARAPGLRRRAQQDLARERRHASSTRSTSTSAGSAGSHATTCASSIASTGRSGRTAGSTTAPTPESQRSTADLADATVVQSRYSLDAHRALGIELVEPRLISNTVDPSMFHPPAARDPLAGRRVRVIATSWSDNPNKGADVLAWLDADLDHERYELTFAGRTDDLRAHSGPRPDPDGAARRRASAERRLPRAEPERPVLERAARGARDAGSRRSSGRAAAIPSSSGDAGVPFDEPRRSPRRSIGSLRSSTSAARRSACAAQRRRRPLPRGPPRVTARSLVARPARARAPFVGAGRAGGRAFAAFAVGERTAGRWTRTPAISRQTARRLGYDVAPSGWARFARDQAVFLTSHFEALQPRWLAVVAPARRPRTSTAGPARPAIRSSTARPTLSAGARRFDRDPGDARGDARARARGGRRAERVHVIPIGIDVEHFALVTRSAARQRGPRSTCRPTRSSSARSRRTASGGATASSRSSSRARTCSSRRSSASRPSARSSTSSSRARRAATCAASSSGAASRTATWSRRVAASSRARTTRSTSASSPRARRAGRRPCSSRWRRGSRSSRRGSGRRRSSSRDGENGLLVEVEDVEAIAAAVVRLPTTPRSRTRSVRRVARPPSSTPTSASTALGGAPRRLRRATMPELRASAGTPARGRAGRGSSRAGRPAGLARLLRPRPRPRARRRRRRRHGEVPAARDALPEPPDGLHALYLGSNWLPRDLGALLWLARRRGIPSCVNQDGVGYPGWARRRDRRGQPPARARCSQRPTTSSTRASSASAPPTSGSGAPRAPGRSSTTRSTSSASRPRRAPPTAGPVLLLGGDQTQAYRLELALRTLAALLADAARRAAPRHGPARRSRRAARRRARARGPRPRSSAATRSATRRRSSAARTSSCTRR